MIKIGLNPGLNYDIPDLDKSEADGLKLFLT